MKFRTLHTNVTQYTNIQKLIQQPKEIQNPLAAKGCLSFEWVEPESGIKGWLLFL
jgi:hypothetical protein